MRETTRVTNKWFSFCFGREESEALTGLVIIVDFDHSWFQVPDRQILLDCHTVDLRLVLPQLQGQTLFHTSLFTKVHCLLTFTHVTELASVYITLHSLIATNKVNDKLITHY